MVLVVFGLVACTGSTEAGPDADRPVPDSRATPAFTPTPIQAVGEPAHGWFQSGCELSLEILERTRRGDYPGRSPDVTVVPREPNFFGGFLGTSHSGPWDYVQEVPLVFYGPGFIKRTGELDLEREVTLANLAPTLAELLDFSLPADRVGRPLRRVLVPASHRPTPPRLILTVVLDGGGWNVLRTWPDAWPNYASLMERGASVAHVTAGSSPSTTPAIHSTIGTGEWPNRHGITGINLDNGERVVGAFAHRSPENLIAPTLADLYDTSTGNESKVGMLAYKSWHLGMLGHGAYSEGGDKDIAIVVDQQERLVANQQFYRVPSYLKDLPGLEEDLRAVDVDDGRLDSTWMGHESLDDPRLRRDTPAWILYQTRLLEALLETEGFGADDVPDLMFTNYKHLDGIGHSYNMLSPEERDVIHYTDSAFLRILPSYLNSTVGKKRWVLAITADHGQVPLAESSHAWPISMAELTADVADYFGVEVGDLFVETSPVGFWFDLTTMEREGITEGEVADFLVDYRMGENASGEIPGQYEARLREPIFSAAFPTASLPQIWACAKSG
jgi:Type I phosphodiesterase / nucleotide pyrophosphatase